MGSARLPPGSRSTRVRAVLVALVLAGVAAVLGARLADEEPRSRSAVPPAASEGQLRSGTSVTVPATRKRSGHTNTDLLRGPHLPASAPVAVHIPELELSVPLVELGLTADGALQAPVSGGDVGWFSGSAAPGAIGPAVIAGHVTWDGKPAVFFELATLARGDRVLVRRRDGAVAVFAVTHTRQVAKARFPTEAVYGATDHAALRLITCGGRFDAADRRYSDNVVVFGRLVSVRR